MSTNIKTDWLQVVTLLSVVVGVALVVFELNQSRELVKSELSTIVRTADTQQLMVLTGEDVASSLAKACTDHESLTDRDILILRRYYEVEWRRIRGLQLLEAWSGSREWELYARWVLTEIFETRAGRIWAAEWQERVRSLTTKGDSVAKAFASSAGNDPRELQRYDEIFSDLLENSGPPSCSKVISRYRSPT